MTYPDQTPPNSSGNAAMPGESRGLILQRGGEEILLEKVADRFTVGGIDQTNLPALAQRISAQVQTHPYLPQVAELVVPPQRRDQAMQDVRQSGDVGYASHVYQVRHDSTSRIYLGKQLTVQFAPSVSAFRIAQLTGQLGLQQVKAVEGIPNTFVFEVTTQATENPLKLANRLMQEQEVLAAEPDIILPAQSFYRPRDPLYSRQWHLNHKGGPDLATASHVFAEQAWETTRGHRSIVVAVMDDAIDLNHPDFQGMGKIVAPRDFKGEDFQPMPADPGEDHGTACAGVAIAEENGIGVVGVAPGCALMPIRTTGFLDDETIEQLFDWAMSRGAAVISCSWGPSAVSYPLSLRQKAALTRAATQGRRGKGCVIVFAAGNANRPTNGVVNEANWPQNALSGPTKWHGGFTVHPNVITVAASTSLNRKAAYSNWGPEVSVCAPSNNAPPGVGLPGLGYVSTPPEVTSATPGLGVLTTDRLGSAGYDETHYTDTFGGTSSACPLVAGVAALVLSANPRLTAQEVRQILEQTADKIVDPNPDPQLGLQKGTYEAKGRCDWFGYGKVNAAKAVQAAVQRQVAAQTQVQWVLQQQSTAVMIPDGSAEGGKSALEVIQRGTVQSLQVTVELEHEYLGDVEMGLVAPSGERVLLQGRTLGRRTRWQHVYTLQDTPVLGRLLGQGSQGRWELQVVDAIAGDSGQLRGWTLLLGIGG
jgi:subtilisin family serine protease